MKVHWTDSVGTEQKLLGFGDSQRTRQRERHHRARALNEILQHYGLKINDWSGSKFIVSDRKGSSAIVQDLGDLWPAVERLIGKRPDPLDPILIEVLRLPQNHPGSGTA